MPEFATDPSGRNSAFGDVHNPADLARSAGGSSGGTAAAVAAGLCLGGTGSDTGGSVRIPASWCGVVGLRPTLGLVDLQGAFPRAPSLDSAGVIAETVRDCALLLNGVLTPDANYARGLDEGCAGLTVGFLEEIPDTQDDVASAIRTAMRRFADMGVNVVTIKDPFLCGSEDEQLLDLLLYEFASVLGERYHRTSHPETEFGEVMRSNLAHGRSVTAERYNETLSLRPRRQARIRGHFSFVDAIATPATQTVAPLLEGNAGIYASSRKFTLPVSFVGLPAMSIPCGLSRDGLPIGMQLITNLHQEALLLRLAGAYESAVSGDAIHASQ